MRQIGLLYHPKVDESRRLAERLLREISSDRVSVWMESNWDVEAVNENIDGCDLIITLGGDGTIIRTARSAALRSIPILGINFGRLGYLAEIEPEEALTLVPKVLADDWWTEKRMLIHTDIVRDAETVESFEVVNDIFIGRGGTPCAVRITVSIDGGEMKTYTADGVVVATPTGSTAYTLAAGGPILAPEMSVMLVTPIVPHPIPYPSLVVEGDSQVDVTIETHHDVVLAIDGQITRPLESGDRICCCRSEHMASFVRLHPPSAFYETLLEKLR